MIYFRGPKGIEKLLSYFGAERTKVAKRYTDCVTIDSSWARSSTSKIIRRLSDNFACKT